MIVTILIVILVLALLGLLPIREGSASYGWGPSGLVGLLLVILLVLLLIGRI